jgi:hypothetical protein
MILIGTRLAFNEIPAVAFYLAANGALGFAYDVLNTYVCRSRRQWG